MEKTEDQEKEGQDMSHHKNLWERTFSNIHFTRREE